MIERPGFQLDFVAREGITVLGRELEAKVEVRNILGRKYQEFQASGANRIDLNSYDIGTTFSGSVSLTF